MTNTDPPNYGVPTGSVPRANPGAVDTTHYYARSGDPYATKDLMNHSEPVNATQVGGRHYKQLAIQPWDYVAANNLGYFEGSIVKYVSRWKDKGGVEDLKKARHFLDKLIEVSS